MTGARGPVEGHIVHVLDDLRVGGAQQLVVLFAREAARRGLPTTVVSLTPDDGGRIGQQLRRAGVELLVVPRIGGKLGRGLQVLRLARLLSARRPRAVQTHLTLANVVGVAAGRIAGVHVVGTVHSTRIGDDGNSTLAQRLETLALRRGAHTLVAVGDAVQRAHLERLAPRQLVVVPNATEGGDDLHPQERRSLRTELAGDADVPLVVAVGRLVPAKGYDDLVTAFTRVVRERPAAVLVVLGEGPLIEPLRALVDDQAMSASIRFVGLRDDVQRVLAASDLYVSSARWEGLPVAMLEAMAAGRAMVVTGVGDVVSVVDPTCGVLVPPGSPDELAEQVLALLDDPARRDELGAAAAARVRGRFGVSTWFDRLLEVYRGVG